MDFATRCRMIVNAYLVRELTADEAYNQIVLLYATSHDGNPVLAETLCGVFRP